jgi:hypothetical protein
VGRRTHLGGSWAAVATGAASGGGIRHMIAATRAKVTAWFGSKICMIHCTIYMGFWIGS